MRWTAHGPQTVWSRLHCRGGDLYYEGEYVEEPNDPAYHDEDAESYDEEKEEPNQTDYYASTYVGDEEEDHGGSRRRLAEVKAWRGYYPVMAIVDAGAHQLMEPFPPKEKAKRKRQGQTDWKVKGVKGILCNSCECKQVPSLWTTRTLGVAQCPPTTTSAPGSSTRTPRHYGLCRHEGRRSLVNGLRTRICHGGCHRARSPWPGSRNHRLHPDEQEPPPSGEGGLRRQPGVSEGKGLDRGL